MWLLNISQNDSFDNDRKRPLTRERSESVQKCPSSPVLRPLEGKAAVTLARGAYRLVREHDRGATLPARLRVEALQHVDAKPL
jgi:hypothetical protein